MGAVLKQSHFIQCYNQINDIEEQIQQDNIKVIPLGVNKKYPSDKDYYNTNYALKRLKNNKGNLGITVGYNHETNGKSISVIDIDGYTCQGVDNETKQAVKKETADYIYECLKNIPNTLIVETQSGGHHIYLWNRTITDEIHETSKNLHFPEDFHIKELQGKSLDHSIEIFTKWKSKQCVLPGSTIQYKGEAEPRQYKVVSETCNFSDINIVEDVHQIVRETLEQYGFIYYEETPTIEPDGTIKKQELQTLSVKTINETAEHLSQYFTDEKLGGHMHNCFLALGGYFCKNITKESASQIIKKVLELTNNKYTKHITTVTRNYERDNENKTGLNYLCQTIRDTLGLTVDEVDKFKYHLQRLTDNHFKHYILVDRPDGESKTYLVIDYKEHEVTTFTKKNSFNKETGEWTTSYKNSHVIMNMSPLKIYESYNILDKKEASKLCFTYYRKGMPYRQTIEGNDIEQVEKQLKKRSGVVLKPREYQGVLNEIIREYVRLDLISIIEDIPVPGIFINPLNGELARADKHGSVPIVKPSVDSLKEGLDIWRTLYDVYPHDKTKLAHIIRYGLVCPFSFIFKTEYEWIPMLFLYGASRTSKTTLAEICLSPYTSIDDEVTLGGDSVGSVYTMGNGLSRQGYGIIINEPKKVINNNDMIEIIKRAVETKYCREKQLESGVHGKIPAYSNMIFTSNVHIPKQDAFVRRCDFLEFTKSERMSDSDRDKFKDAFHHVNWTNTDFLKLRSIGDFFVYYVHENMDLFKLSHEDFVNRILDALFEYCEVEPFEWLYQTAELMQISDSDNEVVNSFKRMVLQDYKRLTSNPAKILEKAKTVDEIHPPGYEVDLDELESENLEVEQRFKQLFITIVKYGYIDYLHYQRLRNGAEYIIVNALVKDALYDFNNLQITCKGLADYMNCKYTNYKFKGKSIKAFRVEYDKFREFLNG